MIKPKEHKDEKERLKFLESFSILDTLPEIDYDNLTAIASEICNTPIALVSLLDNNRQWFKSHKGLDISETSKDFAFCGHAINESDNFLIVQDARKDERFYDNPLVVGDPNIVFYAGVVLQNEDKLPLGTLCVIDSKPNFLNQSQINSLKALANQVMNLLELRKNKILLENTIIELEENNKELERFAYIAAHDIKSPLNNIGLLLQSLSKEYGHKIDSEGQKIISFISQSSEKLKKLIDGLLEYSKSVKLLSEDKTEMNLDLLIAEVAGLFSFENKCSVTLKTNLTTVYLNRTALEQILINLIANANKYCDKEIAVIEIEVKENATHYQIAVKDNGPGILKENQNKIFQIFETLSNTDKFGHTGNGIGLATVKKLIERLGGEINVESELGKGSIFNFTIKK
tara:strand:+ start:100502 stop:101704 length:1203 start_codon:yes stop_codon:yes gene_type:complete